MIGSVKIPSNQTDYPGTQNELNNNSNINKIEEDKKSKDKNEQQENNSDDENLGYNSNYTLNKNTKISKDIKFIEEASSKNSTLSNSISQNEVYLEQISSLNQGNLKTENNEREINYNSYSNIIFNRERLNSTPITNYYQGIDYYLREIQPEKNDYTKSGNFIEKEKFFRDKDFPFKNMKYKSFDLSEPKKFINQDLNLIEDNTHLMQNNNNMINFPKNQASQINIENKIQNSTINNINIINNQPMIMQIPQNYENGKFDMPIYYLHYCDLDCKFNI